MGTDSHTVVMRFRYDLSPTPPAIRGPGSLEIGCRRGCADPREGVRQEKTELQPSRPGEFHPEALTDPDMRLSPHPARATPRKPAGFRRVTELLRLPVDSHPT